MRWIVLVGIALCSSVAGAALLCRAMSAPMRQPRSVSASEPQPFGSPAAADDSLGSASREEPAQIDPAAAEDISGMMSDENRQALSNGLDEAVRARPSPRPRESAAALELPSEVPQGDPGGGTEVKHLARQLAPALAREVLSAQKPQGMPEVERELPDTWKEEKQILAGQRDTVDSVLHAQ